MPFYQESKKRKLKTNGTRQNLSITVKSFNAIEPRVSFLNGEFTVFGDDTMELPETDDVEISFAGSVSSIGEGFKIVHTISQQGGKSVKYTFPDDYKRSQDYDQTSGSLDYLFHIKLS